MTMGSKLEAVEINVNKPIDNIFKRMMNVTAEIQRVAKNLTVPITSEKSYKAVSEGDVLNAVKPLEEKYGIYSYPLSREITETMILTDKYEKKSLFIRIKTVYRFVNVDVPSDYVDQESLGDGVDSQDKASGKAQTYSDKYALLKGYKIQTGEDPDQLPSQELQDAEPTKQVKKPKIDPVPEVPVEMASEGEIAELVELCNGEDIEKILGFYKIDNFVKLTKRQVQALIAKKKGA
jgi:hypothetical protein